MKRYAYCFAIGGKVEWSSESEKSLVRRLQGDSLETRAKVQEFCRHSVTGRMLKLDTGELIFDIT